MTGRVFLVLLLGIVASAALTQWLAVNERTRALERYRDFHALERAEQLITTADVLPAASPHLSARGRPWHHQTGAHRSGQAKALPPTDFSTSLQQRVGPTISLGPLAERPAECDQPRKGAISSLPPSGRAPAKPWPCS
jgi:hypothetical protein